MQAQPQMRGLFDTDTIRGIEDAWLAALGPGVLMERAADAVAQVATKLARRMERGCPVVGLIGPGNNGGDALLALQYLHRRGFTVRALALVPQAPQAEDARAVWRGWQTAGGVIDGLDALPEALAHGAILLDGLFGIGLARPLTGAAAQAVRLLEPAWSRVIAIDVPSGLDAWSGQVLGGSEGVAVRAAQTVTLIADKPGLHTGAGRHFAGSVTVAPLNITTMPDDAPLTAPGHLFSASDAAHLWRPRGAITHKGSFGGVTVVGGAAGTVGAALLAARGAQASGAGRVWIASPDAPVFDPGQPQLMTRGIDAGFDTMDALCVGCGLGRSARAGEALARAVASDCALVLDADALNLVAASTGLASALCDRGAETLLTPHPLEAARLLGRDTAAVQADRIGAARALAEALQATVILKGAGSVVAATDGRWWVIDSGSNALATAGTGDALAGLCAGLLAQGYPAAEAARLGAWIHGAAGDLWHACHPTGAGLSASELPALIVSRIQTFALS